MSVQFDKTTKTYYVRWLETDVSTGKKTHRKKRGFKTKREAVLWEAGNELPKSSTSFHDLIDLYIPSMTGYANEETKLAKYNLLMKYCPFLKTDVRKIDSKLLTKWTSELASKEISTSHKNNVIRAVKSVSKFGFTNYDLPDFAKSLRYFPKSSDDVTEMNIISPDVFARIMDQVTKETYRIFFVFLYHTGVRRGEAKALLKADIVGNKAKIYKSIRRVKTGSRQLKTASSKRTIALDNTVMSEIAPLLSRDGEYLFGDHEPLRNTTIQRVFDTACNAAGVGKFRIHDLRHSFVSNAIMNGANIVTVSKYVGHSSVTQTLNTYSHLLTKSQDSMLELMETIYK